MGYRTGKHEQKKVGIFLVIHSNITKLQKKIITKRTQINNEASTQDLCSHNIILILYVGSSLLSPFLCACYCCCRCLLLILILFTISIVSFVVVVVLCLFHSRFYANQVSISNSFMAYRYCEYFKIYSPLLITIIQKPSK